MLHTLPPYPVESVFFRAVEGNHVKEAANLLEKYPDININWVEWMHWTYLALACYYGHSKIVSLLLAHPGIDVNAVAREGKTALMYASEHGKFECVRLLLDDPRVDVNHISHEGYTALSLIVRYDNIKLLMWWIASGREVWLGDPERPRTDLFSAFWNTEKRELLCEFLKDPENTRWRVKSELGLKNDQAAEVFAPVVFLSDGLLALKAGESSGANRFFWILSRLPIELQMIVSYRVAGSAKNNIPSDVSEPKFRELARRL